MVSAERVLEYTQLPQEAPWILGPKRPQTGTQTPRGEPQKDTQTPRGEPQTDTQTPRGGLSFTKLRLRYRPELELALKGVTCDVKPREKVGVVVRMRVRVRVCVCLCVRVRVVSKCKRV